MFERNFDGILEVSHLLLVLFNNYVSPLNFPPSLCVFEVEFGIWRLGILRV